jgi:hypothetical protein
MGQPRTLPLFDPDARPQCWNERMAPGEYAILYSSLRLGSDQNSPPANGPFCTIFGTLTEAEEDANHQVALLPTLRCRIYDHHGLGRQPIREISGNQYKGEEAFSAGFRRWLGSGLLLGGVALVIVDWHADFGLTWPAMFGTRMIPAGLFLLVTELVICIEAGRKKRRVESKG